jgi:hypothetical protein
LTPTSGKRADTGDPSRQILFARALSVAGSGLAAAWPYVDSRLQGISVAIPVLVGSLLVGFGYLVGGPAMQTIVPNLIRDGELSTAMALTRSCTTVASLSAAATASDGLGNGTRLVRWRYCLGAQRV